MAKNNFIKITIFLILLISIFSNVFAATYEKINHKTDFNSGLLIDGFRDLTIFDPITISQTDGSCTNPDYPYHLSIYETKGITSTDLYFGFVGYNTFNNNKSEILTAIYNNTRAEGSEIIEWVETSGNQSLIKSTKFNLFKNVPIDHIFCLSKNYSNQRLNIFTWQYKEGEKIDLGRAEDGQKYNILETDFIDTHYLSHINYEFGYVIGVSVPALVATPNNQVEDANILVEDEETLLDINIDIPDLVINDQLSTTPVILPIVEPQLNTNIGQIYSVQFPIVTSNGIFNCAAPEKTMAYRQNRMEFSSNTAIYNNQLNVNVGQIQETRKIKTIDINVAIPRNLLSSTNNFKDNGVDARACFTTNLNSKVQNTALEPILNSRNSQQVLDNVFSQTKGYISRNKVFYVLSISTSGILEVCVSRPLSIIDSENDMLISNEPIKRSYNSNTDRITYIVDDPDSFIEGALQFFGLKKKKQLEVNFNISAELTQLNCVPPANSNGGVLDYLKTVTVNSTETGKGCRVKVELDNSFLPQAQINALQSEEFYPHILITETTANKADNFVMLKELVDNHRDSSKNIFRILGNSPKKSFVYKAPAFNLEYNFTVPDSVCNNETSTMDTVVFLPMKTNKFLKALGDFWSWVLYVGSFTIYDSRNENYFDNKYNNVYSSYGALDLSRDSQRIADTSNLYNLDYLYNVSVTKTTPEIINGTLPQLSTNIPDKNFLCSERPTTLEQRLRHLNFNEDNTKFISSLDAMTLTVDNTQINISINPDLLSKVEDFKENATDARVCFEKIIPQDILTELQLNNLLENKSSVLVNGEIISVLNIDNSKLQVCFIRPLNKLDDAELIINDIKYKNRTIEEVYDKKLGRQRNGSTIFSLKTALSPLSCVPRSTVSYVDFNITETKVMATETGKGCYIDVKLKDEFWTPDRISELEDEDFYPHILITKSDNLKEKNYRNLNSFINERKKGSAINIFGLFGYNPAPEANFVYKADSFKMDYNFIVPDTVCNNSSTSLDMIVYTPIKSNKFFEVVEKIVGWFIYIFTFTLVDYRDRSILDYQYDNVYSSTDKFDIGSNSTEILAKLDAGYSFYNLGVLNNKPVEKVAPLTITENLPAASAIIDESKFACITEPKTIEERLEDVEFNNRTAKFVYAPEALNIRVTRSLINIDINSDYLSKVSDFRENGTDARVCFIKQINLSDSDFKNGQTSTFVDGLIISQIKVIRNNQDTNIQVCISRPLTTLGDLEKRIYDIKYKSEIRYTGNSKVNGNNLNIEDIFDLENNGIYDNSFMFSLKAALAPLDCTSQEEETGTKQTFDCVVPEKSINFRKRLAFNEETSRYYYHKAKDAIKLSEEIVALENNVLVYDINIDSEYINKVGNFKENRTDARVCFVKTLDGDVIDSLNIAGTYIDTEDVLLDNGTILIKLKTIRDSSNKLEVCLSRPTRRLTAQESRIRNMYSPKEYSLNAVRKFLGIDWLRKDQELNKVVFRINTDIPELHCSSNGIDEPELQTKVAFDCLYPEPTFSERQAMDYNSENTRFYYATGAMNFNQNTTAQNLAVEINLDTDYLANIYNFKENGTDARVCFIENIANISTNHFISNLYYIADKSTSVNKEGVEFKLDASEETRELRLCISRPVRRLTEVESKITNLRFNLPYDYMLKEEFLGIDWLNRDQRLKNINFSVADFNMAELDCVNPNENQNVPLDLRYIATPSPEGICYDPKGFNGNSGFTGERNYFDYGFNRLLLKWNESDMTHNICDYGFYCDQDQLKIALLKKAELLISENKTTLDEVTFKTENEIIEKNTLLETDSIFKDSVISSLTLTDIKNLSLNDYSVELDSFVQKLPVDLREIIVLKATITPETDLNAETINSFIVLFTDNNFTKIGDDYYFSIKSHIRVQPKITEFFTTQNPETQLRFILFNTKVLETMELYYGDVLTPVVVNTKTFNSLNSGLTNDIFTNTGNFLSIQKTLPISETSEIITITSPKTVKIFIENPAEPVISIKESNLSGILNYYEQPQFTKYKSNILFTNPINAYYFNYTGGLFRTTETGEPKETEIITNHNSWSKVQDGLILSMSSRDNKIQNVVYKNIRPIQILSLTNNSYLLQYTNAGNVATPVDSNMYWYDNIDARLLEISPISGNRYLLQNAKSYKTTIFAFVECSTQKIELFTKRPIQTNNEFTYGIPSTLISQIPEKEYFVIPSIIVNENFRIGELHNINSVFSNITSQNICFNFYDTNRISLWYNPEKFGETQ